MTDKEWCRDCEDSANKFCHKFNHDISTLTDRDIAFLEEDYEESE